jgi:hypothetical protein
MVNKQGQTRLAQYYEWLTLEERRALEGEIVRKCLARNDQQVPSSLFSSISIRSLLILLRSRLIDIYFDLLSFDIFGFLDDLDMDRSGIRFITSR